MEICSNSQKEVGHKLCFLKVRISSYMLFYIFNFFILLVCFYIQLVVINMEKDLLETAYIWPAGWRSVKNVQNHRNMRIKERENCFWENTFTYTNKKKTCLVNISCAKLSKAQVIVTLNLLPFISKTWNEIVLNQIY